MKTPFWTIVIFALGFNLLAVKAVEAAAGKVLSLKGSATAKSAAGKRSLKSNGDVFKGDTIKTGFSSHVQILFADKTKLVIGPRSKISIKEFIIKPNGKSASAFAIKAARGTFRFLSGNSDKSVYKISTKTATIGIRGTGFDFAHRGRTSVLLYSGSVKVCLGTRCALLKNKCDLAVEQNGQIYKSHSSQLPPGAFKLTFPYIRRENNLTKSYRLKSAACDSGAGGGAKGGNGGGGNRGRGGGGSDTGSDNGSTD